MNNIDKEAVGKRIKALRTQKGLTMEKFGELFEPPASKSIVSRWERGKTLPSSERIKKISDIYDISTHYLLYGEHALTDFKHDQNNVAEKLKNEEDSIEVALEIFDFMSSSVKNQNIIYIEKNFNGIDLHKSSIEQINLLKQAIEINKKKVDEKILSHINKILKILIMTSNNDKSKVFKKMLLDQLKSIEKEIN